MITATVDNGHGKDVRVRVAAIRLDFIRPIKVAAVVALKGYPFTEYSYQGGPVAVRTATVSLGALREVEIS